MFGHGARLAETRVAECRRDGISPNGGGQIYSPGKIAGQTRRSLGLLGDNRRSDCAVVRRALLTRSMATSRIYDGRGPVPRAQDTTPTPRTRGFKIGGRATLFRRLATVFGFLSGAFTSRRIF